jgi:hypothetical protein
MSTCRRLGLLVFICLHLGVSSVWAGTGEIRFVETDVDLRSDGSAILAYTVQWQVLSGELHGFYFENQDRLPLGMAVDSSYAVDSNRNRYRLSISRVDDRRWDIVLADGQGVGSGTVTYVFVIQTHFSRPGYVAPTTAEGGRELVVFNWSPVQWDEADRQEHYTLKVLTPFEIPSGVAPRDYVLDNDLVLTEPWVNKQYLIDYQRGPSGRLLVVFHKERPGNRYHMRTQFYLPAEWFDLEPATGQRVTAEDPRPVRATGLAQTKRSTGVSTMSAGKASTGLRPSSFFPASASRERSARI